MAKPKKNAKPSKVSSSPKAGKSSPKTVPAADDRPIFSVASHAIPADEPSVFDARPSHATQGDAYEGELYGDRSDGLIGWVQSSKTKSKHVEVELVIGGKVVDSALANRPDAALGAGANHGKFGFLLQMESWPELPLPQTLVVRVKGGTHVIGTFEVKTTEDLAGVAKNAYAGTVDGVIEGKVRGWCCDLANPSQELSVDVFDNGKLIATIGSGEFRKDLLNAKLAGGYCGFQFALPLSFLDGLMHTVTICFSGTNRVLPNGTFFFGISNESQLTKYVSSLIAQVQSLHRQMAETEKVLLERHETLLAIQRENVERELQVLRNLVLPREKKTAAPSDKLAVKAP